MRPPNKPWLWLLLPPLFLMLAMIQVRIDDENLERDKQGNILLDAEKRPKYRFRQRHTLMPRQGEDVMSQVSKFTPGILLGTKSAIADILWIKADSYFQEGRYERIMPVCHLITWLNPKFLDVYIIGAWHMTYNFLDRRYIPAGVEFLEVGIHNNPDDAELHFEQGHTLMDKDVDYDRAARALRKANSLGLKPTGKRHMLPHALEKAGRIQEAVKAWEELLQEEEREGNWQMAAVSKRNRDLTLWRLEARKLVAQDPLPVRFDYTWSVPAPRMLRVDGTTNLPDYTKINVMVRDRDFDRLVAEHPTIGWQVANLTLFYDDLTVLGGKFTTWSKSGNLDVYRIDLATELAKYPLKSEEYEVILRVHPRLQPIMAQDVTGWDGEGMTGPHVTEEGGIRLVRKSFRLTRDQFLKRVPVAARR